ncbi:WD40 repeat-like protein [Polyplosphaeria fusca]|uniref:WD40 repeat-like protein n=1 Tax=Polyplosphaeria fusca TaxID=682080 RepID=A0A9P4V3C9_9PLEO|nr:WD40 repeat-like protein [Polyplosphaeria fusca]
MPPPTRARALPRTTFSATFSKFKTSTYTDQVRPSAVSQTHYIRSLSWNAPGTLIATGAADRTLRIWNPEKTNAKHSTELKGHQGAVERVAFHPNTETELASCSSDGMVRFWDVRSKAIVGEVKVGGEPFTLAWKPDGSAIVAGRKDNTLVAIDRAALAPVSEHKQSVQTNECVFDWAGKKQFLTTGDGSVRILDYPSFDSWFSLNAHTSSCTTLSMSPSGEYLATGGNDALVTLWDTSEWLCARTLHLVEGPVKSVDFSFDGSYITAGSEEDKGLQIAHTETGAIVHEMELPQPAAQVAWHPCRYTLAYSADGHGLKIIGIRSSLCTDNRSPSRTRLLGISPSHQTQNMDVLSPLNPATLFNAKGLVVVITGGGSGIGLAIASALYQNGAYKIYLLGRRQNVLDDAIKTLRSSPAAPKSSESALAAISADVTSTESIDAAVKQIAEETGHVDVLINNAGVTGPKNGRQLYEAESISQLRDLMLKDWDGWESAMAINTQSVVGVSAAFLPLLEAANTRRGWAAGKVTGSGNPRKQDASALEKIGADADDDRLAHIITVASVASFMRKSSAGLCYNASKSAAAQLGKILASFLAEWGVRSNVICPGPFPSEMTQGNSSSYGTNEVPQGRMGNVNDVAGQTLFLVGKGGAYINGTMQVTDGGRLSVFPSTY